MGRNRVWVPLITSIGVGAAAYQMLRPNNRISMVLKGRMNRMMRQRQLFPNG